MKQIHHRKYQSHQVRHPNKDMPTKAPSTPKKKRQKKLFLVMYFSICESLGTQLLLFDSDNTNSS